VTPDRAAAVLEAATYADFRERLAASACDRCPLSVGRTNIVPDRGNPAADVLVVGEAPGEKEDLSGRSFVGRAGKMLDGLLAEAGLDSDRDCLVTNVVKCRPPDNRPPAPREAAACRPYLDRQFALVKPRLAVLLGATALKWLAPEKAGTPIREVAGKTFTLPSRPGVTFLTLYHPAAALHDPRLRPVLRRHARELAGRLKALVPGRRAVATVLAALLAVSLGGAPSAAAGRAELRRNYAESLRFYKWRIEQGASLAELADILRRMARKYSALPRARALVAREAGAVEELRRQAGELPGKDASVKGPGTRAEGEMD
jgi:DNA polymerase